MTETLVTGSKTKSIAFHSFRRLLNDISHKDSTVQIRLKVADGEESNVFAKTVWLNKDSLLLQNEANKKFIAIADIHAVLEFEISTSVNSIAPHVIYRIKH